MDYSNLLQSLKEKAPSWSTAQEQILLEPFDYLTSIPGKEVRSALIDAFNVWLRVPKENLVIVKKIVQMLHTASLLMDDVEDNSLLRRGIPVAHKIYGIPITINSANYVYFLAYQHMFNVIPPERIQDINDELLDLHRGQGIELYWREHLQCPTEEEYVSMVNNKTGGLFRIAIKLMQGSATAGSDTDYLPLVNLIGILFQIRDDYQNLQSDKYSANKGYCEDLTEGKFSFPVIHSIRKDTTNHRLINILRQRPTDVETKAWAVQYMHESTKSFEYTEGVLDVLGKQCRDEVERLGGNAALSAILDKLVLSAPA